ncbi:MAG: flavodoxin domain-containing protein [Methanotrichaceae archaeon]|nr:flavodoxin domain-containing protein [Methanotrichaceae archaeon]
MLGIREMKALIVFATRYGATALTSQEIAKTLREENFEVKVIDAKKEKVKDISEFELVIVGGGLKMGKWTKESDEFLKNFQKELAQKKLAIFVSSAMKSLFERQGKTEDFQKIKKTHLEDAASMYQLHPIALGLFGGVWDKNKMGLIFRRTLDTLMKQFEEAGFNETSPGLIDTRDIEEIRKWTKELTIKALQ